MGHAGTHLVFDHRVRPFNKECHKFLVAFRISGQVQDILDNLPAIIEPQPELFIVKCERDILAG